MRRDRKGTAIEHQLVLAAHLIHIDNGKARLPRPFPNQLPALFALAAMIGRGIDIDQQLSVRRGRLRGGIFLPDVFADAKSYTDTTDVQQAGLVSRGEITLLVKNLVVRKFLFAVFPNNHTLMQHSRYIIKRAVYPAGVTDHRVQVALNLCKNTIKGLPDPAFDTGPEKKIFGRIPAKRKLGKDQNCCPLSALGP